MNIKILTYNFFQRPLFIKSNKSDYKDDRVELFNKYLDDYDIICFQELFESFNKRKIKLLNYAYKKGFKYITHTKSPKLFSDYLIDGGVVIISKYPIIESDFNEFPFAVVTDGLAKKGTIYAKILINDKIVNLFNVHTQASYYTENKSTYNKYICCRYIQIFDSCKYIKKKMDLFKKDELVIFCGDFNVNSLSEPNPKSTYDFIKDKLIDFDRNIYFNSIKNDKILEYDLVLNTLKCFFGNDIKDIMYYENNKHFVTFGQTIKDEYGNEIPKEMDLTCADENMSKQCLDYIFILHQNNTKFKYKKNSFKIENFFEKRNRPPTQLSDHYGLSIIIE